jgi:hypothetical protein
MITICELTVWKILDPGNLTTLWASMASRTESFTFYLYIYRARGDLYFKEAL